MFDKRLAVKRSNNTDMSLLTASRQTARRTFRIQSLRPEQESVQAVLNGRTRRPRQRMPSLAIAARSHARNRRNASGLMTKAIVRRIPTMSDHRDLRSRRPLEGGPIDPVMSSDTPLPERPMPRMDNPPGSPSYGIFGALAVIALLLLAVFSYRGPSVRTAAPTASRERVLPPVGSPGTTTEPK